MEEGIDDKVDYSYPHLDNEEEMKYFPNYPELPELGINDKQE